MKKIIKHRAFLLEWGTHSVLLPIIRRYITPPPFPYTVTELKKMQSGSLGQLLATFLSTNNFSLLSGYETHDIKHVLLDYAPNEAGEAAMQYFFLGNRDYSLPVFITVVITLFIMPEHYALFLKAFRRGRQSQPLAGTNWSSLLPKNKQTILTSLQIPPAI